MILTSPTQAGKLPTIQVDKICFTVLFPDLFPPLPPLKRLQIKDDVREQGILGTIVCDREFGILDGKNLLEICLELVAEGVLEVDDILQRIEFRDFSSDEERLAVAKSLNLHRRQMSKEEENEVKKAKLEEKKQQAIFLKKAGESNRKIAKAVGTNERQVRRWCQSSEDIQENALTPKEKMPSPQQQIERLQLQVAAKDAELQQAEKDVSVRAAQLAEQRYELEVRRLNEEREKAIQEQERLRSLVISQEEEIERLKEESRKRAAAQLQLEADNLRLQEQVRDLLKRVEQIESENGTIPAPGVKAIVTANKRGWTRKIVILESQHGVLWECRDPRTNINQRFALPELKPLSGKPWRAL